MLLSRLHAPRVYPQRESTDGSAKKRPAATQYLSAQVKTLLGEGPGHHRPVHAQLDPRNKLSRFERDDERLLDDFVPCFFVGNDFYRSYLVSAYRTVV